MSANKYSMAPALIALVAVAGMAAGNPRTGEMNGDDANAVNPHTGQRPGDNNNPVSDETILVNQELFEMRESVALDAMWLGPGPDNLAPIMAGDGWLDEIRAISKALQNLTPRERRAVFSSGGPKTLKGIRAMRRAGKMSANSASRGKPGKAGPAGIIPGTQIDPGANGGNEAHVAINLWQTYVTPEGRKARVPYTFSDDMIGAWQERGDPDQDAEDQNRVAGIANSFAVMLLLEQFLPVRFEGFNPSVDEGGQILLMDSAGTGVFTDDDGNFVIAANTVSRIGRGRQIDDEDLEPTTITHSTWSNFPSMVRSFGFILGLDWEQRHPDRDTFLIMHPENYPPFNFPTPLTPNDGAFTQGLTITGNEVTPGAGADLGPVLFDQNASITIVEDAGCAFDLDSMMLLDPYVIAPVGSTYTVRPAFRFDDLNGDGVVDTTEGGPDDRVLTPPIPLFFSDCDMAQLAETYSQEPTWYFGDDTECPFDINADEIQDGRDAALFFALYLAQDISADIALPFGVINSFDYDLFNTNFVIQSCVGPTDPPLPPDAPWFLNDDVDCAFDLNGDQIQDGRDALLYKILFDSGDPRADIVQPFGELDLNDLDFFNNNFAVQTCVNALDPALPPNAPWFFGKNPDCSHDINDDEVLDGLDSALFTLYTDFPDFINTDPRADIVAPFGIVDIDDYTAFFEGQTPGIPAFAFGPCAENIGDSGWYYGRDPDCPYDINDDGAQNGLDIDLYVSFYLSGDNRADLVPTYGVIDDNDFEAFSRGDAANDIDAFEYQICTTDAQGPDTPWFYGKNPDCPHDVDENGVQDSTDIALFIDLHNANDPAADIFPDYGVLNLSDLQVFMLGDDDGLIPHQPNGDQNSPRPPFIPGYCGRGGLPEPGNRPDQINPD